MNIEYNHNKLIFKNLYSEAHVIVFNYDVELTMLLTAKGFRMKGWGSKLLDEVISYLKQEKYNSIKLQVSPLHPYDPKTLNYTSLVHFYSRKGFRMMNNTTMILDLDDQ